MPCAAVPRDVASRGSLPGGRRETTVRRLTSTLHRHLPTPWPRILVVVLRWWTSRHREVFHIRPDEPGQLAIARFVGRGARWNMFDHSTWRPAYGTLISPVTWFTDDPTTQYRAALAVNALLGGVAVVLLAVLAHRLVGRSRTMAAVLAAIAVLAPAVLFTTNWVWSEALVQVVFLLVLLAALRFHDTMATRWGVVMVLAVALGFGTHSRLLPLAGLAVVLVVAGAVGPAAAVVAGRPAARAAGRRPGGRSPRSRGSSSIASGTTRRDEHGGRRRRPPRARRRARPIVRRPALVPARGHGGRRGARHDRPLARRDPAPRSAGGRRADRARRRRAAAPALHRVHDRPVAAGPDRLRALQRRGRWRR